MSATVVQAAQADTTTPADTALTVTFADPVTAGNTVVVMIYNSCNTSAQSVVSVHLGGSADNFAELAAETWPTNEIYAYAWADPDCAGGSDTVTITMSHQVGSPGLFSAWCYEVAGSDGSLDQSAGAQTSLSNTAISSGSTADTAAGGFWCGIAAGFTVIGTITGLTGPASPWVNGTTSEANDNFAVSGYQLAAAAGQATYTAASAGGFIRGVALVVTIDEQAEVVPVKATTTPTVQPAATGSATVVPAATGAGTAVPAATTSAGVS